MSKEEIVGRVVVTIIGIILLPVVPHIGILVIIFGVRGFILNSLRKSGGNKIISFILSRLFLFMFAMIGLAILLVFPPLGVIYFIIFFFINRKR